jgi:hypothetical protein
LGIYDLAQTHLAAGANNIYYNFSSAGNAHLWIGNDLGEVSNFSCTFSQKQVLTPSATGVTITSTAGGTTYNWESKDSGFDYNDANGYSFEIESIMKPAYLIGYRQESVQCYHDAMDMKISFGKTRKKERKFP